MGLASALGNTTAPHRCYRTVTHMRGSWHSQPGFLFSQNHFYFQKFYFRSPTHAHKTAIRRLADNILWENACKACHAWELQIGVAMSMTLFIIYNNTTRSYSQIARAVRQYPAMWWATWWAVLSQPPQATTTNCLQTILILEWNHVCFEGRARDLQDVRTDHQTSATSIVILNVRNCCCQRPVDTSTIQCHCLN